MVPEGASKRRDGVYMLQVGEGVHMQRALVRVRNERP
jgi:hypothetical protein